MPAVAGCPGWLPAFLMEIAGLVLVFLALYSAPPRPSCLIFEPASLMTIPSLNITSFLRPWPSRVTFNNLESTVAAEQIPGAHSGLQLVLG